MKRNLKYKRPLPEKPLKAAEMTLENIAKASSKKLYVTALWLGKKIKQERDPEQRNAMIRIFTFIRQVLDGRKQHDNTHSSTS